MTQKVKLVCPECGSDSIVIDACARWDVATQAWDLSSTYDVMTCDECSVEFYEAKAVELEPSHAVATGDAH